MADKLESGTPDGRELATTVLEAFKTHRLVGVGESHDLQNHHDALEILLTDPRLPEVVDDIVVEFGNALYQDTVDRFVTGQPVADADLRAVWRNTTQSPHQTWDAPVYEQFYRTVRAINSTLPPRKRIRVLLGDPPIDWSTMTKASDMAALHERDAYPASVVQEQVLAKGHRALLCYGGGHLLHRSPVSKLPGAPSLVSIIEQRTSERTYTIIDLVPSARDPGGLATKLSRYSRGTVIPTAGTWLGSLDAGRIIRFITEQNGRPFNPYCGVPLGSLLEAGLYLGQPGDLVASRPDPATYFDAMYWAELQRRSALSSLLLGIQTDLNSYRQLRPTRFSLPEVPPSLECDNKVLLEP
jgi:hypothetical protein